MVALIVATLWAGIALTRGAPHPGESTPTGPVAHLSRAIDIIRG
jgi:hypothetical protein